MLDMIADYHKSNICIKREDISGDNIASTTSNGITTDLQLHQQSSNARTVTTFNNHYTTMMDNKPFVTAVGSVLDSADVEMKPPLPKYHQKQHQHQHQQQNQRQQQRQKLKIKDFNDVIVCNLCRGYLINATSVDICEHSYCRSCIVKYLETDSNCPNCKPQIRFITLSNLRSDDILKTLVYKLVPGLIQQERERQLNFWKTLDSSSDCDMLIMEDDFIYPAEPISLSLEYHPALLVSCNKSQIPQKRYLQCPASLTVHHLKRFLCSKYDIDPNNQRVDIDIIYEDEILPEDFTLMDVGYCYNWKRVAPMRFCYRILLHSNLSVTNSKTSVTNISSATKVLGDSNQNDFITGGSPEAKRVKKTPPTDSDLMSAPAAVSTKSVRFLEPSRKADKNSNAENNKITYSVYKSKSLDIKDAAGGFINHNNNYESEREKIESSGGMKMIIARKQSPKRSSSEESVYSIPSDFKSLRSNDMRYSDYAVTSNSTTDLIKTPKEEMKPPVAKCDIVVSIPQSQINRSPNSSDESLENLSLAELKTAGKKPSPANSPPKPPKNVPKLKIELQSPKTNKLAIPKPKSAEVRQEPKKISKRKFSIDEQPISTDKLDLKTYAKNIGLKPIEMDRPRDPLELPKISLKTSPDASPMSTSSTASSSSASNGTFSFSGKEEYPVFPSSSSSSHKKRKKKHSKESKDSKRRKLHAEISSQPENESLKMKVKITGNHRAHKVESRKSSSSSDDVIVTTPTPSLKLPIPMAEPTVNGKHHAKKPKLSYSPPTSTTPVVGPVPSISANLNISIPSRTMESMKKSSPSGHKDSESSKKDSKSKDLKIKESKPKDAKPKDSKSRDIKSKEIHSKEGHSKESNTKESNLFKDSKDNSVKSSISKDTKSKSPSMPQIMTTVHTKIHSKSSPQITSTSVGIKSSAPILKPITNIQEMKIPASPPLPPSLFKTTPLTIPTITPTSTKPLTPPIKPVSRSPANTPTPIPALPMKQQQQQQQPIRPPKLPITPPTTKPQFVMPQAPPKPMQSSSHKLSPISSIASSAHKHAAQLKRSASLDGPHPAALLTNKQKNEQDRLIRKTAYGPMFQHQPRPIKPSNPPTSSSVQTKTQDKPFYTSSIASSYTHEMSKRKPLPMLMPPSSISVTKMSESQNGKITHPSSTSAVTITSQKKPYTASQSSNQISQSKPALEILRVPTVPLTSALSAPSPSLSSSLSASLASLEQQQKPLSPSVKSSPPKATRPPPPPIPLVKIKKSQSSTTPSVRSPALTVSTKGTTGHSQASPPGLISMRSIIPAIVASKSAATIAENAPKAPEKPSSEINGKSITKEKTSPLPSSTISSSSLFKERRPSSRDNSVEILDLSGKHSNQPKPPTPPTPSAGNSLEAALNKIKQNMTSSTVPDSIAASANKSAKLENSTDDLQNLHLLSESATNREKIAIKTLPKLNEISKVRSPQAPVRQQNASVRNIPNPSALAFRNQQQPQPQQLPQIPMLNSITSKPALSSTSPTSPTNIGLSSLAPPKPPTPPTTVPIKIEAKSPTPPNNSPSSSTNPGSPPRLKKNLNIEQVAANLNLRAAAAADKSEALASAAAGSAVSTTTSANSTTRPTESLTNKPSPVTAAPKLTTTSLVTSSNVVSSSSSAVSSALSPVPTNRESPTIGPTQPKTSFKSISSLVASSSSSSTVSAGTA